MAITFQSAAEIDVVLYPLAFSYLFPFLDSIKITNLINQWIKNAEHQRFDAFELWCCRKLLRVTWTARSSNSQSLKEINSEYSLEGLMLQLKLQYFGHQMLRTGSLEKTMMLGKVEGRRRRGWWKMRWLDGVADLMDVSLCRFGGWWWTGKPDMLQSVGLQRVWHTWAT